MKFKGESHPFWKGDNASDIAKRRRAVRRYVIDKCNLCEAPAVDRHHIDKNTGNNDSSNLLFLCRRCHMRVDGRLLTFNRKVLPAKLPQPCSNCNKLSKPLRKGLCHNCNEYRRRNNTDRPLLLAKGSRTITIKDLEILMELKNKGLAYRKISAITGIPAGTVYGTIRKHCHKEKHGGDV